jgi:hypothetical protein
MRRNSCTVVVLASPAPGEVPAATARSMNVTLIRPEDPDGDAIQAAAAALQRAGRSTSLYALVAADPLAAVAVSWQAMWDVARPQGPDGFELAAAQALSARRAGRFELPDYYLVLAADTEPGGGEPGPDFDPIRRRPLFPGPDDRTSGSSTSRPSHTQRPNGRWLLTGTDQVRAGEELTRRRNYNPGSAGLASWASCSAWSPNQSPAAGSSVPHSGSNSDWAEMVVGHPGCV